MSGFKLWISCVGSDLSTNCATTVDKQSLLLLNELYLLKFLTPIWSLSFGPLTTAPVSILIDLWLMNKRKKEQNLF